MSGPDHDCDDAVAQLYAFLDGELDADMVVVIRAHLERCSPCLEAFDFEAELRRVVATKCTERMPIEVRARLESLLADPPGGPGPTGLPA